MRKGHRPKRRFTSRRQIHLHGNVLGHRAFEHGGEFHDHVMRMLAVVQRLTAIRLAGLQQHWVSPSANGIGVDATHGTQLQTPSGDRAHGVDHAPIGAAKLRVAALAALDGLLHEYRTVHHEHPGPGVAHHAKHRCRIG